MFVFMLALVLAGGFGFVGALVLRGALTWAAAFVASLANKTRSDKKQPNRSTIANESRKRIATALDPTLTFRERATFSCLSATLRGSGSSKDEAEAPSRTVARSEHRLAANLRGTSNI